MSQKVPMLKMNNGEMIPQFGLGAAIFPKERAGKACLDAFKVGYRHIDTAHGYGNEILVGDAIRESGLPRNEIFLTSKLGYNELGEGLTSKAIDRMLKRFKLDYIDLVLIHWPLGDFVGGWKDMEKAVEQGKIKSIGLSNFYDKDLQKILDICKIKPVVDQVECNPYFPQNKLREQLKSINCYVEAYSPLARGSKDLFNEKIFTDLSKKYKKSIQQIILRWHVDKQNIVFPKSTKPEHLKENIDIFDFKLEENEIAEIDKLEKKIDFKAYFAERKKENLERTVSLED
jgi:diketogulonate reductase-like aldo/keto reductase